MTAQPRFVVVHTDELGEEHILGGYVYTDQAMAGQRIAERRRMAQADGWPDRYDLCRLVPVEED